MEAPQARIDSFKKSKRVKNPNKPSSTTKLKWPHPSDFKANPESLAEAGFYYDPSYDDPDNVTCYICEKELGGWEEDDDPFLIHWTKYVFSDKTRHPNHKTMEKARIETFAAGKGWIHDKTKNHGASSKMMARAGFVFTPQHSGDDLATCLYCNTSLSGWDAKDDPLEEHRKRQLKSDPCPFFSAPESGQSTKPASRAQSTKPPSKPQSKTGSRSVSKVKHQDVLMPTKTFDGEDEEESDPGQSSNAARPTAKTPRKGRSTSGAQKSSAKTPRSKTRSSSRSGLKNVAEEGEEETLVEPPPTVKKSARARSKSVARSEAVEQTEAEEDLPKPPRSKSKAKTQSEPEQEEEAPRKSSRSKSKKSVAPVSVAPPMDEDEPPRKPSRSRTKPKPVESEPEPEEPLEVVTKSKPKHQRTASRSKSKALPVEVNSEPEPEPEPEPVASVAPKKASSKSLKSRVPDAKDVFSDDVIMDNYVPPSSSPRPAPREASPEMELSPLFIPKRTTKKAPTPVPQEEPAEGPEPQPVENEKKKPGRPKAKPKPATPVPPSERDVQMPEPFVPSDVYGPLGPASVNPTSQAPPAKEKAAAKPKPSVQQPRLEGHGKQKMKVVEVSSDEEELEEVESSKLVRKPSISAHGSKSNAQDSTEVALAASALPPASAQVQGPSELRSKPVSVAGKKEPKPQPQHTVKLPLETSRLAPAEDADIRMDVIEPMPVAELDSSQDAEMHTAPSTPPRSTASHQGYQPNPQPSTPPPHTSQEQKLPTTLVPDPSAPPKEPPFIPALSKLPFIPLHGLSDAELDMTVEEWIRYQMEVEFDKFRRDGERELQRFRKRAEEVRKVIESL